MEARSCCCSSPICLLLAAVGTMARLHAAALAPMAVLLAAAVSAVVWPANALVLMVAALLAAFGSTSGCAPTAAFPFVGTATVDLLSSCCRWASAPSASSTRSRFLAFLCTLLYSSVTVFLRHQPWLLLFLVQMGFCSIRQQYSPELVRERAIGSLPALIGLAGRGIQISWEVRTYFVEADSCSDADGLDCLVLCSAAGGQLMLPLGCCCCRCAAAALPLLLPLRCCCTAAAAAAAQKGIWILRRLHGRGSRCNHSLPTFVAASCLTFTIPSLAVMFTCCALHHSAGGPVPGGPLA